MVKILMTAFLESINLYIKNCQAINALFKLVFNAYDTWFGLDISVSDSTN